MKFKMRRRVITFVLALFMVLSYVNVPVVKAAETDSDPEKMGEAISSMVEELYASEDLAAQPHRAAFTFLLDPGHGQKNGRDGGAISYDGQTMERDVNLKIAMYLKAELEKYPNVRVFMTRTTKVSNFETFPAIGSYAAAVNADALISLHNNSASNPEAGGALVCVPNANYDKNVYTKGNGLAKSILKNLVALGLQDRGLLMRYTANGNKYPDGSLADYYGIVYNGKLNHVPSIIVEHAFMSNESDFKKYLSTDAMLKKLAQADAKGIAQYYGLDNYKKSTGVVTINKGLDYHAVYDFNYYVNKYPDIKKAYGNDPVGALLHFVRFGMTEGRQGRASFNVQNYKKNYSDLQKAYGNNTRAYYIHFLTHGVYEGRSSNGGYNGGGVPADDDNTKTTILNGVNYSAVYDYDWYTTHNPDVKKAFGTDYKKTLQHFVNYGMKEGRQGIGSFNVHSYRNQYADLRAAFDDDLKKYFLHYMNYGKKEGRKATGCNTLQNPLTKLNGVDYSRVYDFNYYYNHNADLQKAYGKNDVKLLKHFINYGMKEGRKGNATFDVNSYMNAYADLRRAFGGKKALYYMHHANYGYKEGRITSGVNEVKGYATVYNGVDYSAVYDYNYYVKKYPDIKTAFQADTVKALKHFATYGMRERRQGIATFDVVSYRNQYADLRRAFGTDYPRYYLHYISNGKREGRKATGVKTLQNAVTVYNGVDYSPIYDFNYYISNNADLKKAFGTEDDEAVLKHFVTHGILEFRRAKSSFSESTYNKMRDNIVNQSGKYTIMGSASVTKSQMVKYYKSMASYPAYYKSTDAPTIEDFVQIYIEECAAEGVKVEVAFSQAMLETGYLRYGGLVKIEDKNFAGIGATDSASERNIAVFKTVREGVRAQVQHLKAYASTDPLKNTCVDPRFNLVKRGCARYVEYLSIPNNPEGRGWASDKNYAPKIKNIISAIKSK